MSDETITADAAQKILRECCAWSSPAVLLLSDGELRLEGRFVRFEDDSVQVRLMSLDDLPSLDDLRLGQYCGVSFVHRDQPHFFLGKVTDHFMDGSNAVVEIPLPPMIRAEMRRTLRVPVIETALQVELIFEGDIVHQPLCKNLSLTGALLEFDRDADPRLKLLDVVGLRFTLSPGGGKEDVAVALRGVVRRVDHLDDGSRSYGVLFPETTGRAEPPPELVRIADHVEALWFERAED